MSLTHNPKVQAALDGILDAFKSGRVGAMIARHVLQRPAVPCDRWSLCNRLLVALAGTDDARGIRQWNQAGRRVRKGSRAFTILAPRMVKRVREDAETGEQTERTALVGFVGVPVFRLEDTDGAPIERPPLEPAAPPPLSDVAERFGLTVRYGGFLGKYYGYYAGGRREIMLCTHDAPVFFHELAHAAHHRVKGALKGGQDVRQEAVAELSATVLARLYGIDWTGNAYQYIAGYAGHGDVHRLCLSVLADVEKVLADILGNAVPADTAEAA